MSALSAKKTSKKRKMNIDATESYSVNSARKKKMPKTKYQEEDVDDSDVSEEGSDDEYSSEAESECQDDVGNDELASVKEELSNMSFEELIQLKERLGLKAYNQVMHADKSDQSSKKRIFKRENKNRPMEMSSKRPVYNSKQSIPVKKKMTRDPRFDDLSGEYNEHYFKANYSFINDIKEREKQKIKKEIQKTKSEDRKADLVQLYNRMQQQQEDEKVKDKRKALEKEWKKKEHSQVKQGKKPYFLKKTDLRKLELAEKYKELQKSGKVDNYLSKKRKKTAKKEKKKLPVML